jgi:ATP-binding cassette subfamily B protein
MAGHRTLFVLFLLGLLLEVAYGIAAPVSLKYMIDEAFTPRNVQAFYVILGALVIGGL